MLIASTQSDSTVALGSGDKQNSLPATLWLSLVVSSPLSRYIDSRITSQVLIFIFALEICFTGINMSFSLVVSVICTLFSAMVSPH